MCPIGVSSFGSGATRAQCVLRRLRTGRHYHRIVKRLRRTWIWKATRAGVLAGIVFLVGACSDGGPPQPAATNAARTVEAPAQTIRHESAGVQFVVPAGWRAKGEGDNMSFTSPDGAVSVVVFTAADEDIAAAADEAERRLAALVAKSTPDGDVETSTSNGLPVYLQRGTGEMRGRRIEWSVRILTARQRVVILEFGELGSFDRLYLPLDTFHSSFRPL